MDCKTCNEPAPTGREFCSHSCAVEADIIAGKVLRVDDPRITGYTPEPSEPNIPITLVQDAPPTSYDVLADDAQARKETPIFAGVLNYFPLAIAAVARVSKRGNDQHNPGEPLHWARGKSMDHPDCIARHLIDVETLSPEGEYRHAEALAWRALAMLQQLEEARLGKPRSRGSR